MSNRIIEIPNSGGVQGEYENNLQALDDGVNVGNLYSLPSLEGNSETAVAIANPYQNRITLTVNSATEQRDVNIDINIHSTSGTNTASDLYLSGNVRSDWTDIRFLDSNFNSIPWAYTDKQATQVKAVFKADLLEGDNTIHIDYNRPVVSGDVLKLGVMTDVHYDDLQSAQGRDQALTYLANFNAEMINYQPDAYIECGDKIGAVTNTDAARKSLMNDVTTTLQTGADAVGCPKYIVAFGNHDFDDGITLASVLDLYAGFPGQEEDFLYGKFDFGGFTHISLDAQYVVGTDDHEDNSHKGFGYINDLQIKWLTKSLEEATKPVIIWVHQSLAEFNTERVLLTKDLYHVQNRADIRQVLENSGKVALVMQGHTHSFMYNIINSIPYISVTNLTELSSSSNVPNWMPTPANFGGRWSTLDIDKATGVVRVREYQQVLSTVDTMRDVYIPLNKNIYFENLTNTWADTFLGKYTTEFEKSKLVVDPCDILAAQEVDAVIYPPKEDQGEERLSSTTFYLAKYSTEDNVASRPNFSFNELRGKFKVKYKVNVKTSSTRIIILFGDGVSLSANLLRFESNGDVDSIVGGSYSTVSTYTVGTWYDIELFFDVPNQTYSLSIDGVSLVTDEAFFNTTTINNIQFLSPTNNALIAFDGMRIERYIATPPTITAVS